MDFRIFYLPSKTFCGAAPVKFLAPVTFRNTLAKLYKLPGAGGWVGGYTDRKGIAPVSCSPVL